MFIDAPIDNLQVTVDWPRPPRDVVDALAAFPVAAVADALQRMTVMDSGLVPMAGAPLLAGAALPILTRAGDNLAIHRALDDARPGDVLVINGQGDVNRALIGDLIGEIMARSGVVGAIVDGAIRDAGTLAEQGLSIHARATTPAGPFKHGPGRIGSPVAVGGQVVAPGDIVLADGDGIVVVPIGLAEGVAERTAEVLQMEESLRARIIEGIHE